MSLIFKIYKHYCNANPPPVPCLIVTVYDASYDSKMQSHDARVGEVIHSVMMWHPVKKINSYTGMRKKEKKNIKAQSRCY